MTDSHFAVHPSGPFSLRASRAWLRGYGPLTSGGEAPDGHTHLAFVPDGLETAVGVCLQEDAGAVVGTIFGEAEVARVRAQIERILSLNVDGLGFPKIGQEDPVIGEMQERYPGLRPVLFFSPFEAGCWALLSQRVQMAQAVKAKTRMASEMGQTVDIHGDILHAFPGPARMAILDFFPGLFGRKLEYLRGLGEATLDGRLDAAHLASLPFDDALRELHLLPGIGDFSARLILLRSTGLADGPPAPERRFLRALDMFYGAGPEPTDAEIKAITDRWIPYRTWVTLLLRTALQDEENAGR